MEKFLVLMKILICWHLAEFTWEEYKATTVDPIAPFTTPIAVQ
jgi:hypothetical protein